MLKENPHTRKKPSAPGGSALLEIFEQGHTYSLDCLTDLTGMAAIEGEWKHLEQTCAQPFIYFQSYDWCYGWCREKLDSSGSALMPAMRIYTLRRDGELVFVMPMMVRRSRAGLKCLTFLTEPHGQYGNVICDSARLPAPVAGKFWNWLEKNAAVDVINLNQYPSDSCLADMVGEAGFAENSIKHASVLDLDAFPSWQDYQEFLGAKTRKKRNRLRRKLENRGELSFHVYFGGTDEYRDNVALALEFKKVWLRETGRRAAVLSQDFTKRFLSRLPGTPGSDSYPPEGALVFVLALDGRPIAIEIGTCLNRHYYSYLGAFDWSLRNLSPGKVQMELTQEWSKNAGLGKFDLLGDPADYKSEWVNDEHALESRSICLGVRGYAYAALWKANVRPAVRSLFNGMNSRVRANLLGLMAMPGNWIKKPPRNSGKSL